MHAKLWLLDDPTRGIDVAAKADIYQAVRSKAAQGQGVLVASSDTNELLQWCDRIAVVSRGAIVDIRPTQEWNADSILACAAAAQGSREEQ
jgi:ABC-type sugar transport system ATPase subunit